jgi:hypothetical protein
MSARTAGRLGWSSLAVALVITGTGLWLFAFTRPASSTEATARAVMATIPFLVYSLVGALVVSRRPGNLVGWLLCGIGLAISPAGFAGKDAASVLVARPTLVPGGAVLYALGSLLWELSVGVLLSFLLLLFPDGRLPSPRWRPVAWTAAVVLAVDVAAYSLVPGPLGRGLPDNPLGIPWAGGVLRAIQPIATSAQVLVLVACASSMVVRFRRARGVERQQLKWFTYGAALLGLLPLLSVLEANLRIGPVWDLVAFPAIFSAIPVAVGVAVLRYRLYDIDRLINRTLVYGLLTALLGTLYAGTVLGLGQLFGGLGAQPPSWVVASATLAVAVLFQPARRRVQQAVDRRFNRRRYDAAKTIAAFSARLRDEVDLDLLSVELLAVVEQTMEPTMASLWLRPPLQRSWRQSANAM